MPITLEEAKVGMADKVDQAVVDTFRRESLLLERLIFDDAVSPGTDVYKRQPFMLHTCRRTRKQSMKACLVKRIWKQRFVCCG